MGFRFRRSVKLAPGLRLNVSKRSLGLRAGGRGVGFSVNTRGEKRSSVGVPGTGISYVKQSRTGKAANGDGPSAGSAIVGLVILAGFVYFLARLLLG